MVNERTVGYAASKHALECFVNTLRAESSVSRALLKLCKELLADLGSDRVQHLPWIHKDGPRGNGSTKHAGLRLSRLTGA